MIQMQHSVLRRSPWLKILILIIGCAAIFSCVSGQKRPPRGADDGGGGSGAPAAAQRLVNDGDLDGRQRTELAEEANDPPIVPGTDDGLEIPGEQEIVPLPSPSPSPSPAAGTFRTGTYNAFVMSADKAQSPNPVKILFAGGQVWETVFDLMEFASIDILAVQEIYLTKLEVTSPPRSVLVDEQAADHQLLNKDNMVLRGKYRVRAGDRVFRFIPQSYRHRPTGQDRQVTRREFCPIIFNTDRLDCDEAGNNDIGESRQVHFVSCTVKDVEPELKFRFGCAHFAADQRKTPTNIAEAGRLLVEKVIIGGDFNSNVFGALKTKYADIANLDRAPDTQAQGRFSKISKDGNRIKTRKNAAFLVLDDLIWSLEMRPFYVKNSKRIVDFGKMLPQDEAFFLDYFGLSDHLPVIADFMNVAVPEAQ